jgi:hypothetical protein
MPSRKVQPFLRDSESHVGSLMQGLWSLLLYESRNKLSISRLGADAEHRAWEM